MEIDIVELAESFGMELRDMGTHHRGRCPFHDEKTPSFSLYKDTQRFFCYGCKQSGDAIDLVRHFKNMTFHQAVEFLEINYIKNKKLARKSGLLDIIIEEESMGVDVKKKYGVTLINNLLQAELRRLANGD